MSRAHETFTSRARGAIRNPELPSLGSARNRVTLPSPNGHHPPLREAPGAARRAAGAGGAGYQNVEPPIAVLDDGTTLAALPTGIAFSVAAECDFAIGAGVTTYVADVSRVRGSASEALAVGVDIERNDRWARHVPPPGQRSLNSWVPTARMQVPLGQALPAGMNRSAEPQATGAPVTKAPARRLAPDPGAGRQTLGLTAAARWARRGASAASGCGGSPRCSCSSAVTQQALVRPPRGAGSYLAELALHARVGSLKTLIFEGNRGLGVG